MPSFPRVRMRSRIKVYNQHKTQFSIGTVMSRSGVYTYVLRFNDADRLVSLQDTSTWQFVQTANPTVAQQTSQHNNSTQPAPNHVPIPPITQPTPSLQTSLAHNNTRLPPDPESEIQRNDQPEQPTQHLTGSTEHNPHNLPGENLPPAHPDISPQPATENRQSRKTPARNLRRSKRLSARANLNKRNPSRLKQNKQKRVNFGPPSVFYFDSNTDGKRTSISRQSDIHAQSMEIEGRIATRSCDIPLRSSSAKNATGKPVAATLKQPTSDVDSQHQIDHSLRQQEGHTNATNAEFTSPSAATEHEKVEKASRRLKHPESSRKSVTRAPLIDKNNDARKQPRRSQRLQKSKENKHLPRASSLRGRDPQGRVTKSASKDVEDQSLTTPEHDVQQKDDNMADASRYVNRGGPSCDERASEKMICEAGEVSEDTIEEDPPLLEETWGDISAEAIKGQMASAVETIATKKTQEVIDHFSGTPDLFLRFPDFEYTDVGNNIYGEQVDVMSALISKKMAVDASNFGNAYSNSKEDFREAVALFVQFQLQDGAERLKDIRLREIDCAIERKRNKSSGKAGPSSAGIQSTEAGPSSAGIQSTGNESAT